MFHWVQCFGVAFKRVQVTFLFVWKAYWRKWRIQIYTHFVPWQSAIHLTSENSAATAVHEEANGNSQEKIKEHYTGIYVSLKESNQHKFSFNGFNITQHGIKTGQHLTDELNYLFFCIHIICFYIHLLCLLIYI